jgi:phage baseplate assembly protein V
VNELERLHGLLTPGDQTTRFYGVTVGVVTNNQDPAKLGRVKVHFPWLSAEDESAWARMLTPMAGKDHGVFFLPEVNDEVLVAFEHGQVDFPYVLGALWNGQDIPPETNADGKNDKRVLKSRSGHLIRLDDNADQAKIEIIDKTGKNSVVFDASANTITIKAQGGITLTSDGDITLKAKGQVVIKGQSLSVESTAQNVTVTAQATMDVKANGTLNIKGKVVNIN